MFHGTLLAVVAILSIVDGPLRSRAFGRLGSRAERLVNAYCRAHLPRTTDGEEQLDLTRWTGCCH
jgi:hypothetical protein